MSNMKPFKELEFKDSFMFAAIMMDENICRHVLERILCIPIKKVKVRTLPRSYVIFICTFDPFGRGRYCYTYQEHCDEDGMLLGDETCKIFLNTKGKNHKETNQDLIHFLEYVEKASVVEEHPQDILLKKIQERIKTLKESRRWEKFYMLIGGWGQGLYYEGHEAGRWEKLKELVNRKVQKGCSAEEIADMLEEPLENIQKILRELEP